MTDNEADEVRELYEMLSELSDKQLGLVTALARIVAHPGMWFAMVVAALLSLFLASSCSSQAAAIDPRPGLLILLVVAVILAAVAYLLRR